jgi:hypothetical protein
VCVASAQRWPAAQFCRLMHCTHVDVSGLQTGVAAVAAH